MSSHRALVVVSGIVLSVVARAQQSEPPLLFVGAPGRPAGAHLDLDVGAGTDDLVLSPVVIVPTGAGGVTTYVIIEVNGGLPIVLPVSEFPSIVQPTQGSQGLMNDDGYEDFVVIGNSGTVTVFTGQEGALSGSSVSPMHVESNPIPLPSCPTGARLVATLGAGGSELDDIVVAGSGGVALYLNSSGSSFSLAPAGSLSCPLTNVTDIAVGDVDGDTLDDIAFSSGTSGSSGGGAVQVWKQDTAGGTFTPHTSFTTTMPVASVELVKLNADARADLVLALHEFGGPPYRGHVKVYLANANGNAFGTSEDYTYTRTSSTGTLPTYGASGKIDQDNDLDMVFTEHDSIAYAPGTFDQYNPPLMLLYLENHLDQPSPTIAFTTRGTRFSGKAVDPIVIDFVEEEHDTLPPPIDLDSLNLVWSSDQGAGVAEADESAKLCLAVASRKSGDTTEDSIPKAFVTGAFYGDIPGDGATAEVATGKLVGKSALDIVVPNLFSNSLTVALGGDGGVFDDVSTVSNVASPPTGYAGGPRRVVLTDLTGDGFADAVVGSDFVNGVDWESVITVLHSDTTTGLVWMKEQPLAHAGELAVGDIDGDGFKDVVTTRRLGANAPHDVEVRFGDSQGLLDLQRTPYAKSLGEPGILLGGLDIADLDNDGDLDVVSSFAREAPQVGEPYEAGVVVWRNDWPIYQGLRPDLAVLTASAVIPDVESLALGQVNGSSAPDVAVGLRNGNLWYARGSTTGTPFTLQSIDAESAQQGGGSVAMADFDGNSLKDIVSFKGWPALQSVVQVLHASASNDFAVTELAGWCPETFDGATQPIIGDFNSDFIPDLAIVHAIGEVTVVLGPL